MKTVVREPYASRTTSALVETGISMSFTMRRSVVLAVASLAGAAGALALPAAAQADVVDNGSFSMSGDAGDYITQGLSYSYSAAAGDTLNATGGPAVFHLNINGANGDWWSLDLAAPTGQTLQPGVYDGATRYPFNGSGPGLDVSGNGRGCNTLTGSFTIQSYQPGTSGTVEEMQASFEQHCEGGPAALRGTVTIGNPTPPPSLDLAVDISPDGTFSRLNGRATVGGTVTCSADAPVTVAGDVTQVKNRVLITGPFSVKVDCTAGAPVAWQATAKPTGTTPFQRGNVEVEATATATNPAGGTIATASATGTVRLVRG
jgi:hypothetical protein